MNCEEAKDAIILHVYGELPNGEREALKEHLSSCASCRADYESYLAVRKAWRAAAPDIAGENVRLRLTNIMPGAPRQSFRAPAYWKTLARFTAAAIVLFAFVIFMANRYTLNAERTTQTAAAVPAVVHPVAQNRTTPVFPEFEIVEQKLGKVNGSLLLARTYLGQTKRLRNDIMLTNFEDRVRLARLDLQKTLGDGKTGQ